MEFLSTFYNLIPITAVQGLLYALVAVGVMIPFRILNIPDMTAEGTFPLGGCAVAALITAGLHPVTSTLLAVGAGFLAGMCTALIHLKFRVHSLLAGILTLTMLWSVNLRIMGKPNTPLFGLPNLFDWMHPAILGSLDLQIGLLAALLAVILLALWWGLQTDVGLALRGVGANPQLAPALAVHSTAYIVVGLGLANAITAASGALLAQSQGYADVGMGFGMLVNGLASLIIGEALLGRGSLLRQLAAAVVGSVVYYQISSLALSLGLAPSDLKLITGLFVLAAIGWPILRGRKSPGLVAG
ncbi:ABC transporter permease [Ramlibacter rhizophilus]|uniref:ABC transporter permease n=1 Tax=Ramlibacter rhizophilus TaxID=1781167 RepID=A0A4Z0BH82_9BURK|nr:ABC transporter permease [Ramlibacter rhizophilus]TFY97268.1 ABC transporter permease [Ramlibacter rhizophilus]